MGECGCIYVGDYDPIEVLQDGNRKARKTHKCDECGTEIKLGQEYECVVGKYDGDLEAYRTCLDCVSIRKVFFCSGWAYSMILEHLGEHINEMEGKISAECLLSLTPGARDKVFDMIEDVWEELNLDDEAEAAEAQEGGK